MFSTDILTTRPDWPNFKAASSEGGSCSSSREVEVASPEIEVPGFSGTDGGMLMSRFRLVLLSMFAVLVVCAMGAGSASAACNVNSGKFVFCDHTGTELGTPLALLLALGLPTILEAKVGGAAVTIECKTVHIDITILLLGRTRGNLRYLECKVNSPAGCTVNDQTWQFNNLLVGVMGKPEDLLEGAGAGEEFTKFTIGVCAIAGEYTMTGLQFVEISNGETLSAEHLFIAKKSGSKLKFGAESMSYSNIAHDLRLESGLPWRVLLGT
jgi:hypothetical protein